MAFGSSVSKSVSVIVDVCLSFTKSALNTTARPLSSYFSATVSSPLSKMTSPVKRSDSGTTGFLERMDFYGSSCTAASKIALASEKDPDRQISKRSTILVEGNIGCGKAEFLRYIGNEPSVQVFEEPIDLWRNKDGQNLLDLMYKDPKKNSYKFQQYVLKTMVDQHDRDSDKLVHILERSFYSARYIFVENLWRNKLMSDAEYRDLDQQFRSYFDGSVHRGVDLIVYIRASPETVYKRIQQRGRQEEKSISVEYLTQLHHLYEDWLIDRKFPVPAPVLIIDGEASLEKVFAQIDNQRDRILHGWDNLQDVSSIPLAMART